MRRNQRGVLGISAETRVFIGTPSTAAREGLALLGVNLERTRYDDQPVARLIEREMSRPLLLTRQTPRRAARGRGNCSSAIDMRKRNRYD